MTSEPPGMVKLQDVFLVGMLVIIIAALVTTLLIQPPKEGPLTLNISYNSGIAIDYHGADQVTVKVDKIIDYIRFQVVERTYNGPVMDTIPISNSTDVYIITIEEQEGNQTRMYYWTATKNQLHVISRVPGLNRLWNPEEYTIEEK